MQDFTRDWQRWTMAERVIATFFTHSDCAGDPHKRPESQLFNHSANNGVVMRNLETRNPYLTRTAGCAITKALHASRFRWRERCDKLGLTYGRAASGTPLRAYYLRSMTGAGVAHA